MEPRIIVSIGGFLAGEAEYVESQLFTALAPGNRFLSANVILSIEKRSCAFEIVRETYYYSGSGTKFMSGAVSLREIFTYPARLHRIFYPEGQIG